MTKGFGTNGFGTTGLGAAVLGFALVVGGCGADGPLSPGDPATVLARGPGGGDGPGVSVAAARVRCELRTSPARSKVSVDGRNLSPAGAVYSARIRSGANVAVGAARAAVGDEAEFDFDSNANDIAEGATAIARDFIRPGPGGDVVGEVLDASGVVVATGTALCRVR